MNHLACTRLTAFSWGWNVSQQRVLILGRSGLFAQGVQDILEQENDIEVCASHPMTVDGANQIRALGPDVLILANDGTTDAALVGHILRTYPDLPIVRVGLEDSVIRVYRSEQVAATSAGLLDTIRGLLAPAAHSNHPRRSMDE
jgi:chemotaxis response regulator CheB